MSLKNSGFARKTRTEQFLRSNNIAINPNLPEIVSEENVRIKTPEEIVRRAVTAFVAVQIAIDICKGESVRESARFFTAVLERFGLENELTADEKEYFALADSDFSISKEKALDFQWRVEMCMPLFWACGFVGNDSDLFSAMIDTRDLIWLINGCKDFGELMSHVKMRTVSDILDNADAAFRMDWACVEARLRNDNSISGALDHDVVVEQHKGFNWLIGAYDAEDWDNVRPHT